jgi:hypothetical protein
MPKDAVIFDNARLQHATGQTASVCGDARNEAREIPPFIAGSGAAAD